MNSSNEYVLVVEIPSFFLLQLGLPLSCMCLVPCNTMFGSQHQMVSLSSLRALLCVVWFSVCFVFEKPH